MEEMDITDSSSSSQDDIPTLDLRKWERKKRIKGRISSSDLRAQFQEVLKIPVKQQVPEASRKSSQPDLILKVTNPQRKGDGFASHVIYEIIVDAHMPCLNVKGQSVFRRYNEFLWLHQQLRKNYPTVTIPPIPDKKLIGKFQERVLEERCFGFNMFLTRISQHPALKTSGELLLFLDPETEIPRDSSEIRRDEASQLAIENYLQKVVESYNSLKLTPLHLEQWFDEKSKRFVELEKNLTSLLKRLDALFTGRTDLRNSISSFSGHLSTLQEQETDEQLQIFLTSFAQVEQQLSDIQSVQLNQETSTFTNIIKEHLCLISSFAAMFEQRSQLVQNVASCEALISKRTHQWEKIKTSGKEEKILAAENSLDQAKNQAEEKKKQLLVLNASIREDLNVFEKVQLAEMESSVLAFITSLVSSQKQTVRVWEKFVASASSETST